MTWVSEPKIDQKTLLNSKNPHDGQINLECNSQNVKTSETITFSTTVSDLNFREKFTKNNLE